MGLSKRIVSSLFEKAGVSIGDSEQTDIEVNDPSFYQDVLLKGSLGFGDSYVDGKWDSDKIDEIVFREYYLKKLIEKSHMLIMD